MDAGKSSDVQKLIDLALSTNGKLDIIYANAGISGGTPGLFEQTEDQWLNILQVNLIGPMLAIQLGAPHMIKQGKGAIVCTASVAGIRNGAGSPPTPLRKPASSRWSRWPPTSLPAPACA